MKLLDVVLQTTVLFFGILGALNETMIGLYILPLFGVYQLLSALVHRLMGVKSKSRNIYGLLVALTLLVLGFGIAGADFGVVSISMLMGALTGTFYVIICWKEIRNSGISNYMVTHQQGDEAN